MLQSSEEEGDEDEDEEEEEEEGDGLSGKGCEPLYKATSEQREPNHRSTLAICSHITAGTHCFCPYM